jgi:hypothetical protein
LTGTFVSNSTSVFGPLKPATGFGASSSCTGAFKSGTSAVGQPTTSAASAFGHSSTQPGFGTNTITTGFGAFGHPPSNNAFGNVLGQTQPHSFATGVFGQQQQSQQMSGLFGGGTTSAFGSNANQPTFGTFGGE